MFEELAIQLEADGGDVAALFGAQEVARATNLEVAHGDFEAAAEGGVLPDGGEPFADVGEEPAVAGQEQVGVGLVLVAAHPPAQLVEIAQAEPVGSVNDDGVGGGDSRWISAHDYVR